MRSSPVVIGTARLENPLCLISMPGKQRVSAHAPGGQLCQCNLSYFKYVTSGGPIDASRGVFVQKRDRCISKKMSHVKEVLLGCTSHLFARMKAFACADITNGIT